MRLFLSDVTETLALVCVNVVVDLTVRFMSVFECVCDMRFLLKDSRGFRVNEELSVCYMRREKTIVHPKMSILSLFTLLLPSC